jgi:formylmethanofuran dehydrogenase subunit E
LFSSLFEKKLGKNFIQGIFANFCLQIFLLNRIWEWIMEDKRFKKNDAGFVCKNCGSEVLHLGYTSRNHCPFCLCSLHVDINPGDRANDCGGILRPIQTLPDPKKGFIIIHRCERCGEVVRNRSAHEAKVQPDDMDLIIKLTAAEY